MAASLLFAAAALSVPDVEARSHASGSRHTASHGGHYSNGRGSSHKGGHYRSPGTANRYRQHKR